MIIKVKKKKLNFNINKFSKFKKKIRYLVLKKFPEEYNSWERENYNRNYLINGLHDVKLNDYVMISDLDEIPKITNKKIFQKKNLLHLIKICFIINLIYLMQQSQSG